MDANNLGRSSGEKDEVQQIEDERPGKSIAPFGALSRPKNQASGRW
jgi:hypothetical protein